MASVLVTGVGGTAGTATVRSLLNRTNHEIVGVDMDPDATGFYFLDKHRTVPAAQSLDWLSSMVVTIRNYGIDVVVPIVDEELSRIPELESRVGEDVGFTLPRPEVVRKSLDKYLLLNCMERIDCAVPTTILAEIEASLHSTIHLLRSHDSDEAAGE